NLPHECCPLALSQGIRRLPAAGEAAGAVPGEAGEEVLFQTGDELTVSNLGTRYERILATSQDTQRSGPAPVVRVEASVTPNIRINVGSGALLQSGSNEDVVIRVESNHTATAIGGGLSGIPAPLSVEDARATGAAASRCSSAVPSTTAAT